MNVVGVIAEYNPFHQGHLYHLKEAKKASLAQGLVCVISGNFMQRGEPALVDKWARAEMALCHGADLVIELPVLYATRSAYWFARGSIELLWKTGVITDLAFGVETQDEEALRQGAQLLAQEPKTFQQNLKKGLKMGLSFPEARANAIKIQLPGLNPRIWERPNNILGLAYLQVILEDNLPLKPILIKRKGLEYHDENLSPDLLPSATAIRAQLSAEKDPLKALEKISRYLPKGTHSVLKREFTQKKGPINLNMLTPSLLTLLRRSSLAELAAIVDMREGLENRIHKIADQVFSIEDLLNKLNTKRYPTTRLQRFLIHLLLNYTKEKEAYLPQGPPYIRVLGFNRTGQQLLKKIKVQSSLPVIIKGAHSKKYLTDDQVFRTFWEMDVKATNIYSLLYQEESLRWGNRDYYQKPIFISSE